MKVINLDSKSSDGKNYYSAVINKQNKSIEIFTDFSCTANIYNFLQDRHNLKFRMAVENIYRVCFLGDSANINRLPKKYQSYKIN